MIPVGKPRKSARHDSRVNFADLGGKNQRIQFAFSHPNSEESDDGNYEVFFYCGKNVSDSISTALPIGNLIHRQLISRTCTG